MLKAAAASPSENSRAFLIFVLSLSPMQHKKSLFFSLLAIVIAAGSSAQAPDSLAVYREMQSTLYWGLYYREDSSQAITQKIHIHKKMGASGKTIEADLKSGTPVGLCKVYFETGSLMEEIMFDTVPLDVYTSVSYCGGPADVKRFKMARPLWLKRYFKSGQLCEHIVYADQPFLDYSEYMKAWQVYSTFLYKKHMIFFPGGEMYYNGSWEGDRIDVTEYDFLKRKSIETHTTKTKSTRTLYLYKNAAPFKGPNPEDQVIKMECGRTLYYGTLRDDSENRKVCYYDLSGNLLKTEEYKKGKIIAKK